MTRVLWVHSAYFETESYRDALQRIGYSVNGAENVVDALPKLDTPPYGAVFLSPYFLSWGDAERNPPDDVRISDSLDLGLWFYNELRQGNNSRSPFFLVPIGINRPPALLGRLHDRMRGDTGRVFLCDLTDTLPRELCELVERTLRK